MTPTVLKQADTALTKLLDAVTTVIDAIDSGVYRSTDIMLDTRRNLREKYQMPAWEALLKVRADRELTATTQLIVDLNAAVAEELTLSADVRPEWGALHTCLTTAETDFQTYLKADAADRKNLAEILTPLRGCVDRAKILTPYQPQEESSASSLQ